MALADLAGGGQLLISTVQGCALFCDLAPQLDHLQALRRRRRRSLRPLLCLALVEFCFLFVCLFVCASVFLCLCACVIV